MWIRSIFKNHKFPSLFNLDKFVSLCTLYSEGDEYVIIGTTEYGIEFEVFRGTAEQCSTVLKEISKCISYREILCPVEKLF